MDRSGAKTIVKDMVEGGALPGSPEEPDIEQMTLFDDFNVFDPNFDAKKFGSQVRKVGRPKGSQNKSTIANKEYCQRRGYANALELIAAESMMDPLEVKARFGCSIETAMAWVRDFRFEYAEYTEKKMPRAVELDANGAPAIVVMNYTPPALLQAVPVDAEFEVKGGE